MNLRPRSARIADMAGPVIGWTLAVALAILGVVVAVNGCKARSSEAHGALESQGMTNIDLGGASLRSCDTSETSRKFTATNPAGRRVTGTVCCGLIGKACTVRW